MALAEVPLTAEPDRERWVTTGATMVAVDTLVHNWLHRTGIARQSGIEHPCGRLCYELGGCAEVLETCARDIDARALCPDGPAYFPRLVSTPCGGSAPRAGSTSATATASTIGSDACSWPAP